MVLVGVLSEEDLTQLYSTSGFNLNQIVNIFKSYSKENLGTIDKILLVEFKLQMPYHFLVVDDAMSMANSLEIRVPFLDAELVDFSFEIPWNLKYKNGLGKYILRRAMADILPREVFQKKKEGFGMGSFSWFKDELKEYAENILLEGSVMRYFNKGYVNRIVQHLTHPKTDDRYHELIMTLLSFEIWHNMFIEEEDLDDKCTY